MASSPAPNGAAAATNDGYLPPDWIVPPSDWPPCQSNYSPATAKRPRSRPPPRQQPTRSASESADSGSDRPDGAEDDGVEESDDDDEADETSSSWSSSSWDSELAAREAQLQWDESMRQLQALLNLVAIPWISRYFGRKWAYSCKSARTAHPADRC
ncbi:hypothetical protein C6P46_003412 [Rhodotorula mucilaginosa]|jgi:hypothetical protein|uniref:Uncharacterized protein n=1 Tax=Rhodotorula mucilaginosa TaxID=5537 RepID=A0A9P6W4U2_RHOMI|nr:hypothetical protein C6P46_003412 [Rhodotorula mucilaginosa]TKA57168.1 hypothetical protein B0A53_01124 [Rhodotorula sp. CCFEE 5036]